MLLIAEIGQNHNGDMALARELVAAAKECGADVAKFQLYDARALFPREGNPWFEYNCTTELSRAQAEELAEACAAAGIEFLASIFDVERLGWLKGLGARRCKIASRSIHDRELIAAAAACGLPLIVSLGQWQGDNFPEIEAAGGVDFLYCVSKYPTPLSEVGLARVDFGRYAGFSDHTVGIAAAVAATARGARIVEKHFTLDKSLTGPDHACSMTPGELAELHRLRTEIAQCLH